MPDRTNIVLTRNHAYAAAREVYVVHDLDAALAVAAEARPGRPLMVIGGAQIYAAAMDRADAQILTEVHLSPEGDTHYPDFDRADWQETKREPHEGFDFVWWERRS